MKNTVTIIFSVFILLLSSNIATSKKPNIIFILLDDVSYHNFFDRKIHTPNIDNLVRDGLLFSNFYTYPACSPTRVSLLTGSNPVKYNFREIVSTSPKPSKKRPLRGLPGNVITIADMLNEQGYATKHIGKWHVGLQKPKYTPTQHGFDESITYNVPDYAAGTHAGKVSSNQYRDPIIVRDTDWKNAKIKKGHKTVLLTDHTVGYIKRMAGADRPFFLNLWYNIAHKRHDPTQKWRDRYNDNKLGRYRAFVSLADEQIGRIVKALQRHGLAKDTILFVTSDNGGLPGLSPRAPLRGNKGSIYEGGIRLPLIVLWPRGGRSGETDSSVIAAVDVYDTLAEIASGDREAWTASFLDQITGQRRDVARTQPLYWERKFDKYAIRSGKYKLVVVGKRVELYDMSVDPNEKNDISDSNRKLVKRLKREYNENKITDTEIDWRLYTPAPPDRPISEKYESTGFKLPASIGYNSIFDFNDADFTFTAKIRSELVRENVVAERFGSWKFYISGDKIKLKIISQDGDITTVKADYKLPLRTDIELIFTIYKEEENTQTVNIYYNLDGKINLIKSHHHENWFASNLGRIRLGFRPNGRKFAGSIQEVRMFASALNQDQLTLALNRSETVR